MALITIGQVGEATKIVYDNGEILYSWSGGRVIVKSNNDDIEAVNGKLSPEDVYYKQEFKFSDQTNKYGTTNAEDFVEYLILNDIFFSENPIETIPVDEDIKITQVGKVSYFAWAKIGSSYADPVWKAMRLDETNKLDQKKQYADGGKYTQVATDLTILTYD